MPKSSLFKILPATPVLLAAALAMIWGAGCGPSPRWDVDLSHVELLQYANSHRPFETVAQNAPLPQLADLDDLEGAFWTAYFEHVLQLGSLDGNGDRALGAVGEAGARARRDSLAGAFDAFCRHESTRLALGGIDSIVVPQLARAEKSLAQAFGRFSVHFPQARTPDIFWMYSGFNYAVYPQGEVLGVGLEFYLGADHPAVTGLPVSIYPRYAQRRMVPEHLVSDALRGWLLVHFQADYHPGRSTTASQILYWGKMLYVARAIAPDLTLEQILNWDQDELAWAQKNELDIWIELRKEEILYSKRTADALRWTRDAPFTAAGAVPQESPDRLGWYMGLRWVEDFMDRHPNLSLQELLDKKDVLPFLQTYRPL